MREIFNDFVKLDRRPDGTVRVPLGAEQVAPDLAGLHDGETVSLVMPGELEAEAVVVSERQSGWIVWYGILSGMDAIHDINPEALAEQERARSAAASE